MPSNIQYNTPMPIYSRETAEGEYKSQFGAGPDEAVGANEKHFDPHKSETLRAINEADRNEFGAHFFEKVAQAEAPKVPFTQEPSWTESARKRAERARSTTPSAYSYRDATPHQAIHTPVYSSNYPRPTSQLSMRSDHSTKKGYEFGGLDYVDKSHVPQETYYYGYNSLPRPHKDGKRASPGYEMGGMNFHKGGVYMDGPYHGYGPQHSRLQPRFDKSPIRHDEMNIEAAPNVNAVSADILVGDTISNQHIGTEEHDDQRYHFGTSFGPLSGFKRDHRSVHRFVEPTKPQTFSVSAKKEYMGQGNAGYTGLTPTSYGQGYEHKARSVSAAPLRRGEWSEIDKEVTIETLLNDKALMARSRSKTPGWHSKSMDKHTRWSCMSDPRLARSQTFTTEPNWSRTVNDRRSAWEAGAMNADARVHMPAASKIGSQQPPHWYNQAHQKHGLWQTEADRLASSTGGHEESYSTQTQHYSSQHKYQEHPTAREHTINSLQQQQQQHQHQQQHQQQQQNFTSSQTANYGAQGTGLEHSSVHHQSQPHHPVSAGKGHHETASYYHHEERSRREERQQDGHAPESSSFSSVQHNEYATKDGMPISQNNYKTFTSTPSLPSVQQGNTYAITTQSRQHEAPLATEEHRRSHYESKSHDSTSTTSQRNAVARPFVTGDSSRNVLSSVSKSHKQASTVAPHTVTSTAVSHGSGGEFDRKAEMSETLAQGALANTHANTEGRYLDREGRNVDYKRELVTSVDPNRECSLLKEEERRVVETPLEPGVISRHVTTKYYKKKTVTDTTTTTTNTATQ